MPRSLSRQRPHRLQRDAWHRVRQVGALPQPRLASYTATDLQLNWRVRRDLKVGVGVRDAFDRRHVEFDSGVFTGEIPRTAFVALTWQPQ